MAIPFIDLAAQRRHIGDSIDRAIAQVLAHGTYIMGPEVHDLERQLASFCGVRHAITCANGTDALALVLKAENIGPGDAVLVPAFTFVASAEVVPPTGATPIFIDVDAQTFNLSLDSLRAGIDHARQLGLTPRMVVAVDLFGQPADYPAIQAIADQHGMVVVADAAQSFGATLGGKPVGGLAKWTTTSFFPAKPLGCYGDGGAVFTDDDAGADLLRSLRVHGKGTDKYDNVRVGLNSRLDTLQAAILLPKLSIFPDEIIARQRVADRYCQALDGVVQVPTLMDGATSVWAQFTVVTPRRSAVQAACQADGIPTQIYYPIPLNRQTGYCMYPTVPGGVPVSERLSQQAVSLPMHPYLSSDQQDQIIRAVRRAIQGV